MHVLTLPPRHLVRVTLIAALLALALTALLAAPLGRGGSDPQAGSATTTVTNAAPERTTTVRPPLAPTPEWLANPVRPPSLGAPTGG